MARTATFTAVWLRRVGDEGGLEHTEVLVEVDGKWLVAIRELADGNYSHIAEVNGIEHWTEETFDDPVAEREQR